MKNMINSAKEIFISVLSFPFFSLFILLLLIITPFDYFRYKTTRYYKDTKEKYSWLCTTSYYIKFYNFIKTQNLPIDFYRSDLPTFTGYGYFVYKDTLILGDCELCYDDENNTWLIEVADEYTDIKTDVQNSIQVCNELLKSDVCNEAVVLINKDLFNSHPNVKYDNITFLPVKNDFDAEAIKSFFY